MTETVLDLDDALDLTRTGDLWLLRGRSAADHSIRALTNSPVNHVAMAVALDDLPPLLWHAELGRGLVDVWSGQRQRGVELLAPLCTAFTEGADTADLRDARALWRDLQRGSAETMP